MSRKTLFAGLLAATMLFTAGCSKKVEKIPGNEQKETEETVENFEDIMIQFRGAEEWKEAFSINNKDGEKDVEIDAKIQLLDRKSLPVIEGSIMDFDEKFKEKAAHYLFGDEDIYLADAAHMAREDLKACISELEKNIEFYVRADEPAWENQHEKAKETLKTWQEYLKNATDSYTVTADDFKEDHYMANKDGIWYRLDFKTTGEGDFPGDNYYAKICYEAKELKDVAPKSIPACDYVDTEVVSNLSIENSCRYSLEEAREMAAGLIKEMGLMDMNITKEYSLEWSGWNYDGEHSSTGVGKEVNGYKFAVSFMQDGEVLYKDELHTGKFGGEIIISDAGIVSATFLHPLVIEKISENVKLLSISQIKEGIRQEFKNHPSNYESFEEDPDCPLKYKKLEICYLPVSSEKEPEKVCFLPVWKLVHNKWMNYDIYINAIDGSVIAEKDIVW